MEKEIQHGDLPTQVKSLLTAQNVTCEHITKMFADFTSANIFVHTDRHVRPFHFANGVWSARELKRKKKG